MFQTRNKHSTMEAALKQVEIVDESDLNDCSVEINILSEIKHKNIVGLYETFLHNDKLWVSCHVGGINVGGINLHCNLIIMWPFIA